MNLIHETFKILTPILSFWMTGASCVHVIQIEYTNLRTIINLLNSVHHSCYMENFHLCFSFHDSLHVVISFQPICWAIDHILPALVYLVFNFPYLTKLMLKFDPLFMILWCFPMFRAHNLNRRWLSHQSKFCTYDPIQFLKEFAPLNMTRGDGTSLASTKLPVDLLVGKSIVVKVLCRWRLVCNLFLGGLPWLGAWSWMVYPRTGTV